MARELSSMMPSLNKPEVWEAWEGQWVGGKYPLRVWLGGSEHSAVFATEIPGQKSQKAAVKLIPSDAPAAQDAFSRWETAAKLSHPNLLRILGMGRSQLGDVQLLYVVMEPAEEDLSQILPNRALTTDEARDLLVPVLDALSYIHRQGLVHGHIQPSNLMAAGNQLKLSADRVCRVGASSDRAKTPNPYDAPEVAAGAMSSAADLWSLGVTLVEALTQNLPMQRLEGDPAVPATIPEPFAGICHDCLRVNPQQRSTVDSIKARLRTTSPVAQSASAVPSSSTSRSDRRIFVPVAAVLLLAAALIGRRLWPGHESAPPPEATQENNPSASATPVAPPAAQPKPKSTDSAEKTDGPAKIVDSQGAVLRQVLPDVPRSARNTITGKVKVGVRVDVDPSGKVTAATLSSPGPSQYFARLALKAAQGWAFTPPQVDGQPVSSTWILHFRFGRGSTEVTPTRTDH